MADKDEESPTTETNVEETEPTVVKPSGDSAILAELADVKKTVKGLMFATIALSVILTGIIVLGVGARIVSHHDRDFGRPGGQEMRHGDMRSGGHQDNFGR